MLKKCSKCKILKPHSEFGKNIRKTDGYQNQCKECGYASSEQWRLNNLEHRSAYNKQYAIDNKESIRNRALQREYGLTVEQFNEILLKQNNKCKICKKDFDGTPYVDHNHTTGKVRGFLCRPCNFLIGLAEDNSVILREAAHYLDDDEEEKISKVQKRGCNER